LCCEGRPPRPPASACSLQPPPPLLPSLRRDHSVRRVPPAGTGSGRTFPNVHFIPLHPPVYLDVALCDNTPAPNACCVAPAPAPASKVAAELGRGTAAQTRARVRFLRAQLPLACLSVV
jgi:hypothetical protein